MRPSKTLSQQGDRLGSKAITFGNSSLFNPSIVPIRAPPVPTGAQSKSTLPSICWAISKPIGCAEHYILWTKLVRIKTIYFINFFMSKFFHFFNKFWWDSFSVGRNYNHLCTKCLHCKLFRIRKASENIEGTLTWLAHKGQRRACTTASIFYNCLAQS